VKPPAPWLRAGAHGMEFSGLIYFFSYHQIRQFQREIVRRFRACEEVKRAQDVRMNTNGLRWLLLFLLLDAVLFTTFSVRQFDAASHQTHASDTEARRADARVIIHTVLASLAVPSATA